MFHVINSKWTPLQAKAMDIPILVKETKGEKEIELEDLKDLIKKAMSLYKIEGLACGAIASEYQRKRFEKLCDELNLKSYTPLWGKDPLLLLYELIKLGFKVMIVGIYAYGFKREHLGKIIDEDMIKTLKKLKERYAISPIGEGGEFETFVIDAPHYKYCIEITDYETYWALDQGELIIRNARLNPKVYSIE